jgi:RNA polymerase sigma-70 factor (ECF subfamily)
MNRRRPPFVLPPETVRAPDPGDHASDTALMRAFAAREERAAGALYDRFASRVYGLGVVMLGNDQAAQDLVQDTFVKLWRSADRFDPERGRLETWVLLAARSLAIDALRRRVLDARLTHTAEPTPTADPAAGPDDVAVVDDLAGRARLAMAHLSPEQRSALELTYFGGRTTAEVAALEGIPQGTAKTRIRSALLRLREEMAEHLREDTRDV